MADRNTFPATPPEPAAASPVPRELEKVSLPRYVIEPPDILLIEGVKLIPKSPHKVMPLDVLAVRVEGEFQEQQVDDAYRVDADGSINLPPTYGRVQVVDLTLEEAEDRIRDHLAKTLTDPTVSVSLIESLGAQQITGQHMVGPDGRVNLGTYGAVFVAGMTIEEAKAAVEEQLKQKLDKPEVFVDVLAYNSKVYYVITQGGGLGDDVVRFPVTGNETVLDAVSNIQGISRVSSTRMWIARPAPNGVGCEQVLPVDWRDITQGASTATNYQLMPGDRLYISESRLIAFGQMVNNVLQPFEQIVGFVSITTSMTNRIIRIGLGNTF